MTTIGLSQDLLPLTPQFVSHLGKCSRIDEK
jgi:hypothetical protein